MIERHFIDTNILLYSISTDPAEKSKQGKAIELLDRPGGALSVQVLQEFYVQATTRTRKSPLTQQDARDLIFSWTRFAVQDMTMAILAGALDIQVSHGFSYWDSAIVAAASELRCPILYTEDLSHGQRAEGVQIVNPFI